MLRFKSTQYNGDATANYDVVFTPGMTFAGFLNEVLGKDNWGDIHLCGISEGWPPTVVEYSREHFEVKDQELFHKYLTTPLKSVWANGGWGSMSYFVTLEQGKEDNSDE